MVYRSNALGGLDILSQVGLPIRLVVVPEPGRPACLEACRDGIDNEGDSIVDYPADPGCRSPFDLRETSSTLACDDGVDNDGDGRADYPRDPGCDSPTDSSERSSALACDDGVDNDGDGVADHPTDPGCTDLVDASELGPAACDDGVDDDGDGFIDFPADPGCGSLTQVLEDPQCQDGLNNDPAFDDRIDFDGGQSIYGPCSGGVCPPGVSDLFGDGVADPDPDCEGPSGDDEFGTWLGPPVWSCGLGPELALLLAPLWWLRRHRER